MLTKSDHPKLDALARRRPYRNHWGQRLLSISNRSSLGLRSLAISMPEAPALFFGIFSFVAVASSFSHWGLPISIPFFLMAVWFARMFAYARVSGSLQSDQMEHLQKWLSSSGSLTQAASGWAKPGERWRQKDYYLVRNAYCEEHHRLTGETPSLPDIGILGHIPRFVEWILPSPLSGSLATQDVDQWLKDGNLWLAQAKRAIPADPGGYTPRELKRIKACVRRYQAARQRDGNKVNDQQVLSVLKDNGLDKFFREGKGWLASIIGPIMASFVRSVITVGLAVAMWGVILSALESFGRNEPGISAYYIFHLLSVVGQLIIHHFEWVCVGLLLLSIRKHFPFALARLKIGRNWAWVPLSPVGQTYLDHLLQDHPRIASWFLPVAGSDLRQMDLEVVRRLSRLVEGAEGREDEKEDSRLVDEGSHHLPATQAYLARQRAKKLDAALPAAQAPTLRQRF